MLGLWVRGIGTEVSRSVEMLWGIDLSVGRDNTFSVGTVECVLNGLLVCQVVVGYSAVMLGQPRLGT